MTVQASTVGDIMCPPTALFPDRKFPALISSCSYKGNSIPLAAFATLLHTPIPPQQREQSATRYSRGCHSMAYTLTERFCCSPLPSQRLAACCLPFCPAPSARWAAAVCRELPQRAQISRWGWQLTQGILFSSPMGTICTIHFTYWSRSITNCICIRQLHWILYWRTYYVCKFGLVLLCFHSQLTPEYVE